MTRVQIASIRIKSSINFDKNTLYDDGVQKGGRIKDCPADVRATYMRFGASVGRKIRHIGKWWEILKKVGRRMKGVRNRAQVSNDGKREGGAGSRQLAGAFVPPFPFLASAVPSSPSELRLLHRIQVKIPPRASPQRFQASNEIKSLFRTSAAVNTFPSAFGIHDRRFSSSLSRAQCSGF